MNQEERKMEGIALVRTTQDYQGDVVRLQFSDGSAFYGLSTLDQEMSTEDLISRLGNVHFRKMVRAGMDIAGSAYNVRRELPLKVEVWPTKDLPTIQARPYMPGSDEPENWSVALDLIKL
jgi:hypothetical protein|tara:strand:+ start:306 stop:665 length:360 start_codon:yes stop_codon:yes gene_type:complete